MATSWASALHNFSVTQQALPSLSVLRCASFPAGAPTQATGRATKSERHGRDIQSSRARSIGIDGVRELIVRDCNGYVLAFGQG
jgi:hypothetical protein